MKIDAKQKKEIRKWLDCPILKGTERVEKKEKGLQEITWRLAMAGFNLGMVTGDLILGDRGSRLLEFSARGQCERVENCRISFSWEKLDENRVEVLAYLT